MFYKLAVTLDTLYTYNAVNFGSLIIPCTICIYVTDYRATCIVYVKTNNLCTDLWELTYCNWLRTRRVIVKINTVIHVVQFFKLENS